MDWTPEMKSAAMADARKVVELHDVLKALVSDVEHHVAGHHHKPIEKVFPAIVAARKALSR